MVAVLGALLFASGALSLGPGRWPPPPAQPPQLAGSPPTLIRRSTLLVSNISASLRIYRDILGLEVIYDEIMPIGGRGLPTGVFDAQVQPPPPS